MDTGNPLISTDLWAKVLALPLDSLDAWGHAFAVAAGDGDLEELRRLLEGLELVARLWADPSCREVVAEFEAQDGFGVPMTIEGMEPGSIDVVSFVAHMRARHGRPILRNHRDRAERDDVPDVG